MSPKFNTKFFLLLLFFVVPIEIFAQQPKVPSFISPVNIPISLAGNFCEIRPNHFHSGIDIRTNGKEGLPIFTIGNGYVSRIKVSPTGFGRVVYINHPEGYTSVYAHLSSFNAALSALVDSIQRANESYDMEFFPDAKMFPVFQGDTIGFSGNSGSSSSPHLHFEIRDLKSEEPLNPLAFLNYQDSIAPLINQIRAVKVIDKYQYLVLDTLNKQINSDSIIINPLAAGKYYFEIKGTDNGDDSYGNYYSILVRTIASDTLYATSYDRFNFDETRLVNASINYASLVNNKSEWIRLYKLPVNNASLFKNTKSNYLLLENKIQTVIITVNDFNGNATSDTLHLVGSLASD
ncbi:MAG: M23 family metallopeptidase, partial [Bacteroidota bacterium]